ncbi:MAG: hypothetical protein LC731_05850, partial [Acidobacteria bacterium]|nr:hypothetical protein [Acidobacteriota bacterium]
LGFAHGLLQASVPFLLVRKGHLFWAPLAALVAAFIFNKFVGKPLAKLKSGWPLAIAWVGFGVFLLFIPAISNAAWLPDFLNIRTWNSPSGLRHGLALCFYAGIIGAWMSCVIFGSYLAVALGFNGHNNEAGGAARIEGFKQLIRFRVNRDGLTGYVIGIDRPEIEGSKLEPRIVDVFHLSER